MSGWQYATCSPGTYCMRGWQYATCSLGTYCGEVRVASRGQEIVSVASPSCLLHVCQLRPELSNPSMTSCVPRLVRNCNSCFPRCLLHAYLLCPELSTARVRVA